MAQYSKRRNLNVFSLSFLDVMSCGFGATVLVFLIIHHAVDTEIKEVNRDLLSELRLLNYEITTGTPDLTELQQRLEDIRARIAEARRLRTATVEDAERRREELDELEALTIAQRKSLEELMADIETREEEVERLKAIEELEAGRSNIEIRGEGDRQYLTGLFIGGKRILIAVDASASMLDNTLVNVIRRRNMPISRQLQSAKWQRAVDTVQWLLAQVPIESEYQVYSFNTQAATVLSSDGWHSALDTDSMEDAVEALRQTPPADGTSLENLFSAIASMNPLPDNVLLIIDSLPTQGRSPPRSPTVTGQERMRHYVAARRNLPRNIPVNVILFPMEGDPLAAGAYWALAQETGGVFMSPSEDWP
ncbi:MAG: VWA domain-containing protein [Gammaproteobacteria bacterium]|nr:VWA domain-containing protein [Gammaproteobacteria bacterium]